jgi:hypothetical protein
MVFAPGGRTFRLRLTHLSRLDQAKPKDDLTFIARAVKLDRQSV